MPTFSLRTAGRQYKRQFDTAIRENLIRALTELITNSDDSYSKIEETGVKVSGDITIEYNRGERHISIIDNAEGLTSDSMEKNFVDYGADVSGLKDGKNVRGYFGKGIKDVLFSMDKGRVRSIVDGRLYVSKFKWSGDDPIIEISSRSQRATKPMRKSLGIKKNGTIVDFYLSENIPISHHDTIARNLKNFYMLRQINSNPFRSVILITKNVNGEVYRDQIKYSDPIGDVIVTEEFYINLKGFSPFPIELTIYKSKEPLTQEGDDREGGLLIVDENDAVLDLTLFDFDNDLYAGNLFGKIKICNFRELLKAEERVLSDARDGLDNHHEFYKVLKEQVQKKLKPIVDKEKKEQQREDKNISRKNEKRLNDSIDKINDLLSDITSQDWAIGSGASNNEKEILGIQFTVEEINIIQGSNTRVRLQINTDDVPPGSSVRIKSSNRKIQVSPNTLIVLADEPTKIVGYYINVLGKKSGEKGEITAQVSNFNSRMNVNVIEDQYPKPNNGFAFIPDEIVIPNNDKRYGYLYVSNKIGSVGDIVSFKSDNPNIRVLNQKIELEEKNFKNEICMIRIRISGFGIGQSGEITANLNQNYTSMSIEVISKRNRRKQGKSGLISGYDFSEEPHRKRSYYDEDTGIIWICLKHPTISKYFSGIERDIALSLPHCQLLLSEVILEEVAWIARKKLIETNKETYLSDDRTQEDLIAISKFKYQHGEAIHSWLVDESAIQNSINFLQK